MLLLLYQALTANYELSLLRIARLFNFLITYCWSVAMQRY